MKRILKIPKVGKSYPQGQEHIPDKEGRPGQDTPISGPHAHVCTDDVCYEKRPWKPLFQNLPQELTDAEGVFP